MAYTTTITNTTTNPLVLYYRASAKTSEGLRPLLSIYVEAKALLQKLSFSDEESFNDFKFSNQSFIDSQTIILGKTTENKAMLINEDTQIKTIESANSKFLKQSEGLKTRLGKKSKLELEVAKED